MVAALPSRHAVGRKVLAARRTQLQDKPFTRSCRRWTWGASSRNAYTDCREPQSTLGWVDPKAEIVCFEASPASWCVQTTGHRPTALAADSHLGQQSDLWRTTTSTLMIPNRAIDSQSRFAEDSPCSGQGSVLPACKAPRLCECVLEGHAQIVEVWRGLKMKY